MIEGYIPKDQRKNILLLSDDLRLTSGIGRVSNDIVLNTAHHFNWIQLGGAASHPDNGKAFDLSQSVNEHLKIPDSYVKIYCINGYGDGMTVRQLIEIEKIDAIMIFTDPRYWIWFFQLEHEIRSQGIPIIYYNIWDDLPYPFWNRPYYASCDLLMNISKQTHNIVKNVLGEGNYIDLDKKENNGIS